MMHRPSPRTLDRCCNIDDLRQLDGATVPLGLLPMMRDALGSQVELIVDGGVRSGTQIIKALVLSANAVSIGRLHLYGLASGGKRGVKHALALLKNELERSMALMGCKAIQDIGPASLHPRVSR